MAVEPGWTDYNGHMNMAYHNVLFDRGLDLAFDAMGVGAAYVRKKRHSLFTAEVHVRYLRELHAGDMVRATVQIIDHDDKRLHTYKEIRHEDGWLAATCETLSLHVDMSGPKVVAFPPEVAARIGAEATRHAKLPRPERIGRSIGIRRVG